MSLSTQDWAFILGVASVASSLGIILTLFVLVRQTSILQRQTQSAIDSSRAQNHAVLREEMLKINEVFLMYPEIRKYFYREITIDPNNDSYARAEAGAEMLFDIMEHMLQQATMFPSLYHLSPEEIAFWKEWDTYIVDMLVSSPLLREYLRKRREWYTPKLFELMKQAENKLNQRKVGSN